MTKKSPEKGHLSINQSIMLINPREKVEKKNKVEMNGGINVDLYQVY